MNKSLLVLSTGFALFSMFFGSGNLVFPLVVGQESSGHYLLASLGIITTGVVVPFLGVFGMMLYNGSIPQFFNCFGTKGPFWFSLLALSLMGPFGVLARCLTVAHGGLQLLFPNISLPLASVCFCMVIFALTVNKSKIVSILGTALTPFLLLAIASIAYFGLSHAEPPEVLNPGGWNALKNGFFQGYQTMDLLAAFFFATFILQHLNKAISSHHDEKTIFKVFFKASLLGAGTLSLVYFALVMLGSFYAPILETSRPQDMLGIIAMRVLGPFAAPAVCVAVILACITTAIVLASLFADFLRKEIAKEKIGNPTALSITLAIGFAISTLDFVGIAKFLGPILEAAYPALIVLTLANIAHKMYGVKTSHWPVTLILATKLIAF